MSNTPDATFDDSMLSGYLDGELTQSEHQRVRLRLEDDADARRLLEQMREIRQAARSTELPAPTAEEWREAPRTPGSRWLRRSGWLLICSWAVVLAALAVWGLVASPGPWWEKTLAAAIVGGPLLLFLSVLIDRLEVLKSDRYRRVEK